MTNRQYAEMIRQNYIDQRSLSVELIKLVKDSDKEELEKFLSENESFYQQNKDKQYYRKSFQYRNQFVNLLDEKGFNGFHYSVIEDMKEKQQIFLKYPLININQPTGDGYTPFTLCILRNNYDLMKQLLERDDFDEVTVSKNRNANCFHVACEMNSVKAVDLLIKYELNPFKKDQDGKQGVDYATDYYITNTLNEYMDHFKSKDDSKLELNQKPSVVFGYIQKISQILNYKAKRLIVVDPFSGVLMRYKKKEHFP